MFITFEGIDGSGKSTQIHLLKEKLVHVGQRVEVFREPGGTEVSEHVRSILLNPAFDIHPVTELLLFSAARSQLISEKVFPLLKDGVVVILDRFFDSTTAYQGYGRNSIALEHILELNKIASHGTVPDITFYLKIELEEANIRTAGIQKDRMERSGDVFYENVIEGFNKLAQTEDRFSTLDATLSTTSLHRQIWEEISLRLNE